MTGHFSVFESGLCKIASRCTGIDIQLRIEGMDLGRDQTLATQGDGSTYAKILENVLPAPVNLAYPSR